MRGSAEGFSDIFLGLIGSGYRCVGFLAGSFIAPPMIRRIGRRPCLFFAAATAAATLPLWSAGDAHGWIRASGSHRYRPGRALHDHRKAGSTVRPRANSADAIFAIYMMVNLGALALAQQLLRDDEFDRLVFTCSRSLPAGLPAGDAGQAPPAWSSWSGQRPIFHLAVDASRARRWSTADFCRVSRWALRAWARSIWDGSVSPTTAWPCS